MEDSQTHRQLPPSQEQLIYCLAGNLSWTRQNVCKRNYKERFQQMDLALSVPSDFFLLDVR